MGRVHTFSVKTPQTTAMLDITRQVQEAVINSKVMNGICVVFVPIQQLRSYNK